MQGYAHPRQGWKTYADRIEQIRRMVTKIISVLETKLNKDRLKDLGMFSLEKMKL